ncbi:hypothetical protein DW086_00675 [Harryflintia acetispora]|nr:hypothetical protein DW086_00675 [Harryflintia acetispora]
MKKRTQMGLGVGASSILLIFVLLCLTTFATLSLVSAQADARLSEKTAETVSAYYEADARAEELLAQIGEALKSVPPGEGYLQTCAGLLAAIDGVDVLQDDDGLAVSYQVAAGENQQLQVSLTIPATGGYRLTGWKTVNTAQWQEGEPMSLWPGELG